jgi:RHS repeat-associated protein
MKRLFYLVLVLPALLLLAAVQDSSKTATAQRSAAKTTPSGRPGLGLDLGQEMAGPLSQPVLAVSDGPKTEFERDQIEALLQVHRAKARPAERLTPEMLAQQVADVEQYIVEYPDGEWTPGLRVEMGKFYRTTGRFSKSLEHWRAAWAACAPYRDGNGKLLADEALARLASMLTSLGRVEELQQLFLSNPNRVMSRPHLAQVWLRAREATAHMVRRPGAAYRCGPLALFNAARQLNGTAPVELLEIASPVTGFSLQKLVELAGKFQLPMVAAVRQKGTPMVTPAVVHWRENHYAAVIAEQDGQYLVQDPTFLTAEWIDGATLEAEASGYFLIPAYRLMAGWRSVPAGEAAQVFGQGYPQAQCDDCPPPHEGDCCEDCQGGYDSSSGTNAFGMATWKVQEPNINLKLQDIPMSYTAAFGPDFMLKLQWGQRWSWSPSTVLSHFDGAWQSDLLSFVEGYNLKNKGTGSALGRLFRGNGSLISLRFQSGQNISETDFTSGVWAERVVSGSTVVELIVYYRNGSVEHYELVGGSGYDYRITWRRDATAKQMTFTYDDPRISGLYERASRVTLADGAQFDFHYADSTDVFRITSITGPNSRSVTFTYTPDYSSSGTTVLTGITDVVGIVSAFEYDPTTWWVTKLVTPYGTNTFTHFDAGSCDSWGHDLSCAGVDRSIVVTEPTADQQVFLFYDNSYAYGTNEMTGKIPAAFSNAQIPTYGAGDPQAQTLDLSRDERNSHHWNRHQAAQLSTTSNLQNLTAADYRLSRTKHWLIELPLQPVYPASINAMNTLAWTLPPSPDGSNEAQPTFYDYASKTNGNAYTGASSVPSVIAEKRPDGTTWYRYFERNANAMTTRETERWVAGGTTLFRTNSYTYASGTGNAAVDGLLRVKHVGPDGQLVFGYALHPTYNDQVKYLTNAVGVEELDYDANRRITTRKSPAGLLSTNIYDGTSQRLIKVVDSISGTPVRTNSYTWLNGYVRTHTDPYGMTRTFDYDLLGRLTTTTYPDSTTEVSSYSLPASTGFNTSGSALPLLDRVSFKDRLGNYWWTLPNRVRQVEKIIEPPKVTGSSGTQTTVSYCGCGAPTAITRASNTGSPETTSFEYNYQGGLRLVTLPDGAKFTNLFDLAGQLIERQDYYQKITNTFDNLGRLLYQRNGAGLVLGQSYDRSDRVLTQTNANGVWFTNAWDAFHRLTVRAQPDGGKEYWGYTTNFPGATAYTNQVSDVTKWAYDASLRKTNETVVGVYTNSFIYNGADNLRELYDGKTQKTAWAYDLYSRVTNKADHLGTNVLAYAYNANGWLTNRWSNQKGNTEYRYDPVGNLTNVNYPATADLAFEYDALNRVVKDARNGVITNTYTYYAGGQLKTEATPQWASSTLTLGYTSRLRTSLTLAQPTIGNWTHTYTWDNARRLDTLTGSSGTVDYDYIAAATSGSYASRLVTKLAVPTTSAGPNITNRWDTTGRLTETKLVNGGTTFNRHAYALNVAHQRTQQTRPDSTYVDYTYDDAGQVATALSYYSGGSPITTEQLGYGYDTAQNLTKRTNNATVTTYSVNSLNQVTGDGMLSFGYDGNGNRSLQSSGGASITYTYDDENQLVQAETDTLYTPSASRWKTMWAYDARGRVRVREDYSWYGPGSYFIRDRSARYLYDGMRVIQERNENNTPQVTYTRGLDLSGSWERAGGIGGLLARTAHSGANGVTYTPAFYHADGNGNITYLLKLDQTAGATYQFDPYGRLLTSSGTLAAANTYRFSSKELMLASGFYSFGYRFYDPATQRWVNRDPIGEDGGVNLYRYVGDNPINLIDPFGLSEGDLKRTAINNALQSVGSTSTYGDLQPVKGTPYKFDPNTRKYLRFDLDASHKDPNIHFFDSLKDMKKNKTSCKVFVNAKTAAVTSLTFLGIGITMVGTLNAVTDNPNYREALAAAKAGDKAGAENALYELSIDSSIESGSTAPFYIINSQIK